MSVNSTTSKDGGEVTIAINGRFDFSLHQQFRDAYSQFDTSNLKFVLNLSKTEYMDSSALGMILLLKDHTEMYKSEFVIKNPTEAVDKILKIAQFHRLMTIE